jgi:aspartate kinase
MAVLVQKYGGSSLATMAKLRLAADRVAGEHRTGRPTVVVVSARGDTTDDLVHVAHEVHQDATNAAPREVDQLMVTGEAASAAQLALALIHIGVPAVSLTGPQAGIKVTGRHGAAVIDSIDPTRILRLLDEGNVVVIGGFHGINSEGDVATLGRGGSDTTAVAVAAALDAERCEIFTDVDGIYTADPRIVPDARKVSTVDPAVMAEMAFAGAGVLHSRSVELAAMKGVEVHVRNSAGQELGTAVLNKNSSLETSGAVVAITHDADVARVLVQARGKTDLAAEVLEILARHSVPVDLIARSGPHEDEFRMGFTISRGDVAEIKQALETAAGSRDGSVHVDDNVTKVSLVGTGLLSRPTYIARMTAALSVAGIPTSWVFTSQLRASVTVPRDRALEAVTMLHKEFGIGQDAEPADPPRAA